jgi:hypothetical protein
MLYIADYSNLRQKIEKFLKSKKTKKKTCDGVQRSPPRGACWTNHGAENLTHFFLSMRHD